MWTYRFRPLIDGRRFDVRLKAGFTQSLLSVDADAHAPADVLRYHDEPYRVQQLRVADPAGELLFEAGPRNWYSYGLRVSRGGVVLYESHPDPLAYVPVMQAKLARHAGKGGGRGDVDMGRLKRNAPAIATDIALGLLFFVVAKLSDLRTAALVAAGAGIALYGVQWLLNRALDRLQRPHIDLLGGLAMFGIVMLLISAGFSWYFDSELAVQLKSTYLGLLAASFFAIDAWRGGPYLGKRLSLYLAYSDIDPQRLAAGFALVGAAMALVNAAIALTVSRDLWLYYSLWGDLVLAMVLSMWAIERARRGVARQPSESA